MSQQYPKFLAFIHLFYPTFYEEVSYYSEKSEIVEAKLICRNDDNGFTAMVFSQGEMKDGKLFSIRADTSFAVTHSWNWCWVFAVKIYFKGEMIFPLHFKQKVIALPDGNEPLTTLFFKVIEDELISAVQKLMKQSVDEQRSLADCYASYLSSEKK